MTDAERDSGEFRLMLLRRLVESRVNLLHSSERVLAANCEMQMLNLRVSAYNDLIRWVGMGDALAQDLGKPPIEAPGRLVEEIGKDATERPATPPSPVRESND